MGVSANKDLWSDISQQLCNAGVIMTRITSYMGHHHLDLFTFELLPTRIDSPQYPAINISIYTTQRFEGGYSICRLDISEISGMPNFINIGQKFLQNRIKSSVRIRYKSNSFHN